MSNINQITETASAVIPAGGQLQKHINEFGNVNIASGVPDGLARVEYDPILKKLKIPYAKAMNGFKKRGGRYFPLFGGVVIEIERKKELEDAITMRLETKRLREQKSLVKIKAKLTTKLVGEALYVLNKHAKSDKSLYATKGRVLNRFAPAECHINTFKDIVRKYIIRSHYDDEDAYESDLFLCEHDDEGRPYINGRKITKTQYYNFYEIEGFGFHSPTGSNSLGLPEKKIGDGEMFIAPRVIDAKKLGKRMSLETAKLILNQFCQSNGANN